MPITTKPRVVCDSCQKEKQEVNHWYLITPEFGNADSRKLTIFPLPTRRQETYGGEQVACGEECVLKLVSGLLEKMRGMAA